MNKMHAIHRSAARAYIFDAIVHIRTNMLGDEEKQEYDRWYRQWFEDRPNRYIIPMQEQFNKLWELIEIELPANKDS